MALPTTELTRFPGGIGQFLIPGIGVAPNGEVTATGVKTTDKILCVQTATFGATVDVSAITDVTSRFSITAADKLKLANDGGADLTGRLVLATISRPVA